MLKKIPPQYTSGTPISVNKPQIRHNLLIRKPQTSFGQRIIIKSCFNTEHVLVSHQIASFKDLTL